jgi:hypothetical protein
MVVLTVILRYTCDTRDNVSTTMSCALMPMATIIPSPGTSGRDAW